MSKIALCSPHHEPNHGTLLQAYALAKAIENLGYKAEYISYEPFVRKNKFQKIIYYIFHPIQLITKLFGRTEKSTLDDYSFFNTTDFINTKQEFTSFYETMIPKTKITYNPITIKTIKGYSNFIVGSDQTWSPSRYKIGSIYFLDFLSKGIVKNSYAPSLGTINVPDSFQSVLKQKLTVFNHLSCREAINCELIKKLTNKDVTHVVDPTMLLTIQQWDTMVQEVQIPKKYILCYILGEKESISQFAEKLSQEAGIPVYYIVTRPLYLQKQHAINDIGPSHFIWLIKHAQYVITDSFHGTIFSMLYNKDFYSFTKRDNDDEANDNSRIWELLKEFDLTSRFVNDGEYPHIDSINYEITNSIIVKRRKHSLSFLKQIIINNEESYI